MHKAVVYLCLCIVAGGCDFGRQRLRLHTDNIHPPMDLQATSVEYPDVKVCSSEQCLTACAPRSVNDGPPTEFWDLTLADAVALALEHSEVIRDLGGQVLTTPDGVRTKFDPALQEADPLYGPEAALSAFDAQVSSSLLWSRNDRAVNNIILGGGTRELRQNLANFNNEISKTTVTGSRFAVRNLTQYDESNQPGNRFPSAWDTQFEVEARQPLLQGAGVEFNRIAGPNAQPGFYFANGVLIARTNTDISIAEFELGVRDFISQVEEAYWDLYFAYRHLDANLLARDSALETWNTVSAQRGLPGGTVEREARARVQYYAFQDQVQEALNGNPRSGRSVGVYRGERRLRMLLGLSATDDRLIRPSEEPNPAKVIFCWEDSLAEALTHRAELRRQKWQIKRNELELIASRNFALPRLDAIALYRFRGFGDNLTGDGPQYSSAFQDLESGDHQEWQLGFELTAPVGFRRAITGIRQAQLKLTRSRAVYEEQEFQISHSLSNAISEMERAYAAVQTNYNRLNAAQQRFAAAQEVLRVDKVSVDVVLESQQDVAAAQTAYFEALTAYAIGIKNVHREKGTLLAYNGIQLGEGAWPQQAYSDAAELRKRFRKTLLNYKMITPGPVSLGRVWPQTGIPGPEIREFPALVEEYSPQQFEVLPAPIEEANPMDASHPEAVDGIERIDPAAPDSPAELNYGDEGAPAPPIDIAPPLGISRQPAWISPTERGSVFQVSHEAAVKIPQSCPVDDRGRPMTGSFQRLPVTQ